MREQLSFKWIAKRCIMCELQGSFMMIRERTVCSTSVAEGVIHLQWNGLFFGWMLGRVDYTRVEILKVHPWCT